MESFLSSVDQQENQFVIMESVVSNVKSPSNRMVEESLAAELSE